MVVIGPYESDVNVETVLSVWEHVRLKDLCPVVELVAVFHDALVD